jgi:NAD(P)-dependent dehydrogenase (short-subunit alcohol dehydrogenase family)
VGFYLIQAERVGAVMTSFLDDKVAVITGAGSQVGRAMANLFAEKGAAILVVDELRQRPCVTIDGGWTLL